MPKSPHDTLALVVFLGSFFMSAIPLSLAKRRFTDAQRIALADRSDHFMTSILFICLVCGYYYAPVKPFWPVVVAAVGASYAAFRVSRLHAGQSYSPPTRALLVVGIALMFGGPVVAVLLRAAD
jgi:nitrate reductase gamma subunit